MAKNKFKGVVVLSRDKYNKLDKVEEGTLYVKDQFVDTPEKLSELENDLELLNKDGIQNASLDFKNKPKVGGKDIALKEEILTPVTNLESESDAKPLAASQGKVLNDKITAAMEVMHGKNNAFTVKSFLELRLLFGIEIGEGEVEAQDSYKVSTNKITYNEKEYTLKNGDVFYLVREDVPDYWFSSDDMTLYAMETNKVDLTEYALITYVDSENEKQNKEIEKKANDNDLAKVAKTNNYNDLDNKPEDLATTTYVSENYLPIGTKVGELENDVKYATEEFVNTNGGKIDKIKVNGIEQEIKDKTVDLTIEHPEETFGAKKEISGKDLNTIIEQGNYGIASDCNNLPIVLPGTLFVGISEKGNYPQQTFIDNADGVWIRNSTSLDNSTWSEWKKLTNTKDLKKVEDSIPELLSELTDDADNRLVTDVEKETWNKKAGLQTENGEIFNNYTNNVATGGFSHAEGNKNTASGFVSHAEGSENTAQGDMSHAEGINNKAIGDYSHVEGQMVEAEGLSAHAEGTMTKAIGVASHAEGGFAEAHGIASHASGYFTKADQNFQTAIGVANEENKTGALFSVGNGTLDDEMNVIERKTIFEVFQDGRVEINGSKVATVKDISDVSGYATTEYVNEVAKGKVDNIPGKGLSTNDFTDDDKDKLDRLEDYDDTDLKNLINTKSDKTTVNGIDARVGTIETAIPTLATQEFVNSSIATNTATFKGTFDSLEELQSVSADANDYGFVVSVDTLGNRVYKRYKYTNGSWKYEYDLNNSSFTEAQWSAINSGIDATKVSKISSNETMLNSLAEQIVTDYVPKTRTINGKPLSANVTLNANDVNALPDTTFIPSIEGLAKEADVENLETRVSDLETNKEDKSNLKALAYKDSLSKSDVGLGNVNNTSDANKPISTATQAALDLKANESDLGNLAYKDSLSKSDVGLANVDNTSDLNKPISTATQNALNLKADNSTVAAIGTRVSTIEGKIPTQASSTNQLADKDFVNSTVSTATATFRGTYDEFADLKSVSADKNDYAFVETTDSVGNKLYKRYKYVDGAWVFEYDLNNSSFTQQQWATINSGVTASDRQSFVNNITKTTEIENDLKTRPTYDDIPDVYDGALIIKVNGATEGRFTANQSGNSTVNISVPTGTASNSNVTSSVTATNDLPTSNAIISYVTGKIGEIHTINELSDEIIEIYNLEPGIYSLTSGLSKIYNLKYKSNAYISDFSFQYGGGVLILTDAKFGHSGSGYEPVKGNDFVFIPGNEGYVYYGYAHQTQGESHKFYMNSNYITRTVNNLSNYYTKSETYTQSEVDALISAITGADPSASSFMLKNNPIGTGSFSLNRRANTTTGSNSVALGYNGTASGSYSVSLGYQARATGTYAVAMGYNCGSSGTGSVAEGYNCDAYKTGDHAEGVETNANAYGGHSEGGYTNATGWYSHSEGFYTNATHRSQHVGGEYSVDDTSSNGADERGTYVEIIGNGSNSSNRSNARTLDWNGNETLSGNVTATGFKTPNGTSRQFLKADGSAVEAEFVESEAYLEPSVAIDPFENYYTKEEVETNYIKKDELLDYIHPILSYYESDDPTDPGILFGGVWQKIEGVFMLSSNSNYLAGTQGGDTSHYHTFKTRMGWYYGSSGGEAKGLAYNAQTDSWDAVTLGDGFDVALNNGVESASKSVGTYNGEISTGTTTSDTNMPPYRVTNRWQRIA